MDQARFDALARRFAGAAGAPAPVSRRTGVRALAGALLAAGGLAPAAEAKKKRKDPPVSSTPECVARFNAGEKNLAGCDLRGARFVRGRTYEGYDFTDSSMSDMDLSYVTFRNCSFKVAALWRTSFYDATLIDCDFSGAVIAHEADWRKARITGGAWDDVNFTSSRLSGVQVSGGRWHRAIFERARLDSIDFKGGADMQGARFSGARCEGRAHMSDLDLTGADLSDSRFWEMSFTRCRLEQADLTGISLRDASFSECRLNGAMLGRLVLDRVSFRGSTLEANTCPKLAAVSSKICDVVLPNGETCHVESMCRRPPAPAPA